MRSILAVKSHSQPRQIPVSSRGPSSPSPVSPSGYNQTYVAVVGYRHHDDCGKPAERSSGQRRRRLAILGHIHQADRLSPSSCRLWLSCLRRRGALSFRSDRVEAPGRAASLRMTYRPHKAPRSDQSGRPSLSSHIPVIITQQRQAAIQPGGTVTANRKSALVDFVTLIGGQNSSPTIIMGGMGRGARECLDALWGPHRSLARQTWRRCARKPQDIHFLR